jgi:hypothetical protein
MTEKQILGFNPPPRLEHIAANIPSACRIANVALIDAMILPYDANLGRMEFLERTGLALPRFFHTQAVFCRLLI